MMTEVCLNVPRFQFSAAASQVEQAAPANVPAYHAPPRCAVHSNETFVRKGTSAADLAALFQSREP